MSTIRKRRLLLGTNAFLVTFLGFGILVFLYKIADRHHIQIDLSADSRHELSPEMHKTLSLIDANPTPIEVIAFTAQEGRRDSGQRNRYVEDYLKQLDRNSLSLSWKLIDYDQERLTAEKLGVSDYGRVVILQGNERVDIKERVLFKKFKNSSGQMGLRFLGEEELLRAFKTLLFDEVKKAYITSGHGELSISDNGPNGLSLWKRNLELNSFDVSEIQLLSVSKIPEDADLVVIAQPKKALSIPEQDVILNYISRGGGLIIAYKDGDEMELLSRLQVKKLDGVATDVKAQFPYWDRPIVHLGGHEMTKDIQEADLSVVVSHSSSFLEASNNPSGIQQHPIMRLSRQGWLERGGDFVKGAAVFQEGIDSRETGYLGMAIVLSTNSKLLRNNVSQGRVIILGDAEWFGNSMIEEISGNAPMINNMVQWVIGDDTYFTTGSTKRSGVSELLITKPQLVSIRWLALLPMPTLVFGIGWLVWYNRRGR
jgi:hypothetical protein